MADSVHNWKYVILDCSHVLLRDLYYCSGKDGVPCWFLIMSSHVGKWPRMHGISGQWSKGPSFGCASNIQTVAVGKGVIGGRDGIIGIQYVNGLGGIFSKMILAVRASKDSSPTKGIKESEFDLSCGTSLLIHDRRCRIGRKGTDRYSDKVKDPVFRFAVIVLLV